MLASGATAVLALLTLATLLKKNLDESRAGMPKTASSETQGRLVGARRNKSGKEMKRRTFLWPNYFLSPQLTAPGSPRMAGGWMVEKTGIGNEVAILDSRG